MCGRFTLRTPLARVAEIFELGPVPEWARLQPPRYNVAPSQAVAAVRWNAEKARRELGWTPRKQDLRTIVADAWGWLQRRG